MATVADQPSGALGRMIATTGCNVLSLRGVQLKGPIVSIEPATADDHQRLQAYCDAFFADVAVVDSIPRWLMERLVPADIVAVVFDVTERYDQTPGPNAGAALISGAR